MLFDTGEGSFTLRDRTVLQVSMAARENDPDRDLVRRAQGGDTQSFDQLVIKYSRQIYSLIYNMTS
ncbi:MAG: hypothetical protein VX633_07395, partial [Verrucomicrobiota bacterium]|nr:hypothetical protein [Verrucomicrobiota bacterium]